MDVPGWPVVFRGSDAVAAGLVTPGLLRGPAFDRLLPDVYGAVAGTWPGGAGSGTWPGGAVARTWPGGAGSGTQPDGVVPGTRPDGVVSGTPLDLRRRSLAAYRWAGPGAVLCGYSAAELLGRSCAPPGAPAEVVVAGGVRSRAEVRVRRDRLHPGEITDVDGVRITSRLRTAFDLARWRPLTEGVVAVDALARGEFAPDLLLNFAARYPGLRGVCTVPEVLGLADPRSGSPPETRLRLLLTLAGLPRPAVQHPVLDDDRRRAVWLDLAYPEHRLGVEYDGGDHLQPDRVRSDIDRHTRLVAAGWRVLRYTAEHLRHDPARIVTEVTKALNLDPAKLHPF